MREKKHGGDLKHGCFQEISTERVTMGGLEPRPVHQEVTEGGTNREKEVGERGSGIPQIEHHFHQLFP